MPRSPIAASPFRLLGRTALVLAIAMLLVLLIRVQQAVPRLVLLADGLSTEAGAYGPRRARGRIRRRPGP
jgi:hypothetical protein